VKVWHHSHVRDGAVVGDGTQLGKNVYVDTGAIIGRNCRIQNNVSVYRGVALDDGVFVGPSVVFTNDLYPRASSPNWKVVPTNVREGASIGANATILCGITIGEWAMVGAGSVVIEDVDPHHLVVGNPAQQIGWVCKCGAVVQKGTPLRDPITCRVCNRVLHPPN
jgi:acetyltransferase-like isoleucine patch superfamily enzyme